MSNCNHDASVKMNWLDVEQVKPGVLIIGGVCGNCGESVKMKLERKGTVSRSDFYLEGIKAFD